MNRNGRPVVRRRTLLARAEALEGRTLLSGIYYIGDAITTESDPGTTSTLTFRIDWVGSVASQPGSVMVTTSDGTAFATGGDYVHRQAVVAFPVENREPRFKTFTVTVNGDSLDESNETVVVTLSLPGPALIGDATGVGTIAEDDDHRPTGFFQPVSPSPRALPVESVPIWFSEFVYDVDVTDFTLTRNGGPNLLTAAQTLATADNQNFVLGNLSGLTGPAGSSYELRLRDAPFDTLINDGHNNWLQFGAVTNWATLPGDADPDDQIAEAMAAANGAVEAQLGPGDNVDMYKVAAAAGDAARFEVRANPGNFEIVLFPHLRLFNAAGVELAGDPAAVNFTFPAAGTYYVGISDAGNVYNPTTGADTVSTRHGGKYLLTVSGLSRIVGPVTGELRVNTHQPNKQAYPATAMDDDGDFVVVWQSHGQDAAPALGEGVYAQRFGSSGAARGAEFLVNATTLLGQTDPAVAMDGAGNFVVVWESGDTSGGGIFARLFNADGVARGGEFRVNPTVNDHQSNPSVAMDADGDFVVAWEHINPLNAFLLSDVFAQRFDETGMPVGPALPVNTETEDQQRFATTAMDAAGNFVIAWASDRQDLDNSTGIYAKHYNAAGAVVRGEFPVHNLTSGDQFEPAAAMDADGDFVVTWHGYEPQGNYAVYGRRFDTLGLPKDLQFKVSTTVAGFQRYSAVAMDDDGDFVVTWQDEHSGPAPGPVSIMARQYGASGAPVAGEFVVNVTNVGNHRYPATAMDADGDFAVAWAGYGQDFGDDANTSGVYARVYGGSVAPYVVGVAVRGTAWGLPANASFGQYLEASGIGSSIYGFGVSQISATATLPWTNLNEIVLYYSSPVSGAGIPDKSAFVLDGIRSDYQVLSVTQLDPQRLLLTLDRVLGNQGAAGSDGDRVRLTVPGGDGGGPYSVMLNTLAGDADRATGRVNANDVGTVRSRQNRTAAEVPPAGLAPYSPFADVDATGRINANDLGSVRARSNDALPAVQAAAAGPFSGGPPIGPEPDESSSVTDLLRAQGVLL